MSNETKCPQCGAPIENKACEYCKYTMPAAIHVQYPKAVNINKKNHFGRWLFLCVFIFAFLAISAAAMFIQSINISDPYAQEVVVGSIVAGDTVDESAKRGTRDKPIALGESGSYKDSLYDYSVEITVTEVLRADAAWKLVKSANKYNTSPGEGKEYILMKVKIKALNGNNDKKISISSSYNFEVVSQTGVSYDKYFSVHDLEPELSDIFPGGETEGYICKIIDEGDVPIIGFQGTHMSELLWFKTGE